MCSKYSLLILDREFDKNPKFMVLPLYIQGYTKLTKELTEKVWSERIEEFKARPKCKF